VVEFQITEAQAREIAGLCAATVEVATPDDCTQSVRDVIRSARPCRVLVQCLKVKVYSIGDKAVFEVADTRQGKSLCESGPTNVCLRVGLKTLALRDQIVETASPTSTTGGTMPPSTSTDTSSATSSATSSPSTPDPTSSPTTSP
jgi:hypothetical protein